jgi:hypothetical protein
MPLFSEDPTAIIFKDADGKEKTFLIDASLSLNTSLKAKVTSYPVEGRGFISDHVQPEPLRLRIDGLISQSPDSTFLAVVNAALGFIKGQVSSLTGLSSTFATAAIASGLAAAASQGNQDIDGEATYTDLLLQRQLIDNDFPKNAMQGLVALFKAGNPFRVRTFFSSVLYTDMVATSLSFPQDAKMGDSLRFTMECVKVNIVAAKVSTFLGVTEMKAADPANSSATETTENGNLTGKKKDKITESETGFLKSFEDNKKKPPTTE